MPNPTERDINGNRIKVGMRVTAYQRRYHVTKAFEDADVIVYEAGDEKPLSDVVHHVGIVAYEDFGWRVVLDEPRQDGVVAIRMSNDIYAYELWQDPLQ